MESLEIKMLFNKFQNRDADATERENFYIRKNIETGLKYFKKLKKENPNMTDEEMRQKFEDEQYELLVQFSKTANIKGKYFQYATIKDLLKNKNKIAKVYNEVKDEQIDINDVYYNVDMENNYKSIIKTVIGILRDRQKELKTAMMVKQYMHFGKEAINNVGEISKSLENIRINDTTQNELKNIEEMIEQLLPIMEKGVKDQLINSMESMGSFFEKFNFIPMFKALNISTLKNMGLSKLDQPLCMDRTGKKETDIEKLFSHEYLQNLSVEDILVLNAFWQNRFAKESERIDNAVFAISQLGLLEKKKGITQDDVDFVNFKTEIISGISEILTVKIHEEFNKASDDDGYKSVDVSKLEIDTLEPFQDKYEEIIYQKTGRKGNNLINDYFEYALLYNQIQNAYICKSGTIVNIMSMLENKKIYTNWGCVLDEVRNGKTINSVKAGSQYILLCIDYESMNMPLRVHVDKKFIKTYLENTGQDMVLPIYEGNEDFINKNKVIPTNIFMPVSSKYKKVINEYLKEINLPEEKKRLLEHLRYIKDNSKYPEHLKDKMGNKNRRMVNIETGEEVGVERKNGEDGR